MNIVRSLRKDTFKEFLSGIRNGDLEKVKNSFNLEFINKRILDEPNGFRPIHVACEHESVEIVKFLIDRGCDFEQRTNESLLPIHIACSSGSAGIVDCLLKKKNQLEAETKEKYRPVHFACKHGKVEILLLLINHKCNLSSPTINGYLPIHLACEAGHIDIVHVLLSYNCPIDVVTKSGMRPIDLARNKKEIIAMLSEKNCLYDFKGVDDCALDVPLDIEDLSNYGIEVFNCVRKKKFDQFSSIYDPLKPIMNDVESQMTVMEYAISEKAYEFVELILNTNMCIEKFEKHFVHFKEKNADIFHRILEEYSIYRAIRFNMTTEFKSIAIINQNCILTGTSFFELAVKYGSTCTPQLITKLLNKNETLWNKVKTMAQDNLNYGLYKLISDREKYLDTRNEALWTRMHVAVDDNDLDMVKYLLKTEPETPMTFLASVGSPLNLAAISGRIECFKLLTGRFSKIRNSFHGLIKNGMGRYCVDLIHLISDINEEDENGNTLLHVSAQFLSLKMCTILLEENADPNLVNDRGNTALHEMILFNFSRIKQIEPDLFGIVQLLLRYRTNINMRNNDGKSIFQESLQMKNVNLILLIMDNQDNIEITRDDLKIIMDNNWIDVLELILPQALNANEYIDQEMLMYFLKNRSIESFNSVWFLADPQIKKNSVTNLLYQCAMDNKTETFSLLSEEEKCELKLLDNGETLLTALLKLEKEAYCHALINSNLSWSLVNQLNSKEETGLHIAAIKGFFSLLENMLYISENINQEDCNGNTAFSILISSYSFPDEIERISKLIISKTIVANNGNSQLSKAIENCKNFDLKMKLSKLFKVETERRNKSEEIKNICNVCLDNVINTSFGCGHTSCSECAQRMKICPICRRQIQCRNSLFL